MSNVLCVHESFPNTYFYSMHFSCGVLNYTILRLRNELRLISAVSIYHTSTCGHNSCLKGLSVHLWLNHIISPQKQKSAGRLYTCDIHFITECNYC